MGIVVGSLERAGQYAFTRPIPKSAGAQMRYLVKQHKGFTREVAALLGVSQRTVERYVRDQIKTPKTALADRIGTELRRRWQPLVRKHAAEAASKRTGLVIETRARFGFTAAPGTSDDGRMRRITQHLPPEFAGRLLAAQTAGATGTRTRCHCSRNPSRRSGRGSGLSTGSLCARRTSGSRNECWTF
ncbi:telomere-protecting terminal protein Tpg [Streptomyces sp. NPDC057686]|uniref:telomere-protecting terminal protein Tpg n=1 Tax=Streptomyces sp. NPDC057686 TaxID=3346212 RepID=UPI0036A13753